MKVDVHGLRARKAADADAPRLRLLINQAYGRFADLDLNVTGTTQDDQVTRQRMAGNDVYVVIDQSGEMVGTVTLSLKHDNAKRHGYVYQLAVGRDLQGHGIGGRLMDIAEARAKEMSCEAIRLDTPESVERLVAWYQARGYMAIDRCRWPEKNYWSVVMEKPL